MAGHSGGLTPSEYATQAGVIVAGAYAGWQRFQKWRGEREEKKKAATETERPNPCQDELRIIDTLRDENRRITEAEQAADRRAERAQARAKRAEADARRFEGDLLDARETIYSLRRELDDLRPPLGP